MGDKKGFWALLLELLASIFASEKSEKTTADVIHEVKKEASDQNKSMKERLENSGEAILEGIGDAAKDEAINQAGTLLLNHGDYLLGLTEAQRAYAVKVAMLKAIDNLEELDFDELKEYRNVASEAIELGINVAEEMNTFWTDFGDAVKAVVDVAADVGVRAGCTALKVLLPLPI